VVIRGGKAYTFAVVSIALIIPFYFFLSSVINSNVASGIYTATAAGGISMATSFAGVLGLLLAAVYGVVGLGYLYCGVKDGYKGKRVDETVTSRLFNQNGPGFKGLIQSISAAICSPFLILGGFLGKTIKESINAYNYRKTPENVVKPKASFSRDISFTPDLLIAPSEPRKHYKFFARYNPKKNIFEGSDTSLPPIEEESDDALEFESHDIHYYGCCK